LSEESLGFVAGGLSLAAYLVYAFGTLCRGNKPRPVTWAIWAFTDSGLYASLLLAGAGGNRWFQLAYAIGNTTTAAIALIKGGLSELTKLNRICLTISSLAVLTLVLLHNPSAAILLGLLSKGVGITPTVLKLWHKEGKEYWPAWILWLLAALVGTTTVREVISLQMLMPLQYGAQCVTVLLLNIRASKSRDQRGFFY